MADRRKPMDALQKASSISSDPLRTSLASATPMQAGMPDVKGMLAQLVDEAGRSLGQGAFSPARGALGMNEFAPVEGAGGSELLQAAKRFGIPIDKIMGFLLK